jgi:hypothetical protein
MQHKSIIHNKQVIRNLFFYAIFCLIFQIFIAIALAISWPKTIIKIKQFVFKILPYFSYIIINKCCFELTQALDHIQIQHNITTCIINCIYYISWFFLYCLITYKLFDRQSVQGKFHYTFLSMLKNIAKAFLALTWVLF